MDLETTSAVNLIPSDVSTEKNLLIEQRSTTRRNELRTKLAWLYPTDDDDELTSTFLSHRLSMNAMRNDPSAALKTRWKQQMRSNELTQSHAQRARNDDDDDEDGCSRRDLDVESMRKETDAGTDGSAHDKDNAETKWISIDWDLIKGNQWILSIINCNDLSRHVAFAASVPQRWRAFV